MRPDGLRPVPDERVLEAALSEERAVLFKHSRRCSISSRALEEVQRFAEEHPDVPVYVVDVIGQRALSRHVARRLDLGHESPQVIVLRAGRPVWDESHFAISATAIARETTRLGTSGTGALTPPTPRR